MKMRPSSVNQKCLTGEETRPVAMNQLKRRVNAIKYRTSSYSTKLKQSHNTTLDVRLPKKTLEQQTDALTTNFWPSHPTINQVKPKTVLNRYPRKDYGLGRQSQDISFSRSRTMSVQNRKFRIIKSLPSKQQRGTVDALTYQKQLQYFSELYDHLGAVLSAIQTGLQDLERAITDYGKYIRNKHMSFIDDFMDNKGDKIRKAIRISRIHQYLSIAYLFLQIAQERMDNNQSYLVNFIGFCLSNLLYLARVYIILERRPQFQCNQFEKQVQNFEINSYGKPLRSIEDVVLRIQHNNQTITIIHKKLGRYNSKFQNCIKMFLKNAERKKHSTCLCAHYIFQYLAMHIHESQLIGISEFLQVAPTPYLAPPEHEYTLIIQPLGIIKQNQNFRPFLMQFIKWANKHFDVVLWTWQMPAQVEDVAEILDPYLFSKLYRYHCQIKDGIFTKNLNSLGRDLSKTLIIDYDERIYAQTPKNGIVCRWKRKSKDKALLIICEIFEEMLVSKSSVEEMLTFYTEQLHAIRGI